MDKYLRQYAEPEVAALDGLTEQAPWENVMVIPACNETPGLLRPPPPCAGRSLMILVINQSPNASADVSRANQHLAMAVQTRFKSIWQSSQTPKLSLGLWQDALAERDVLLVDRFSEGRRLPERTGVGLARKIGADLAAGLIHQDRIRSRWIHCTDADVNLPVTYFSCCKKTGSGSNYSALVYPFAHRDDPEKTESREVLMATRIYELSLRYYVAGMRFAGSPYAFHTIGSTMAVNASRYAMVRGFPKREAGEDFYLLNKLAKVGPVLEPGLSRECLPIEITSRRSDRVPFGTGAAVNKITSLGDPLDDFQFYHPVVFELLGYWLRCWPRIWQSASTGLSTGMFADVWGEENQQLQMPLLGALKQIKADQAITHAFRQSKTLDQFSRHLHTWFDAFRTLKLIHILRDSCLPSITFAQLEGDMVFRHFLDADPELLEFHNRFSKDVH